MSTTVISNLFITKISILLRSSTSWCRSHQQSPICTPKISYIGISNLKISWLILSLLMSRLLISALLSIKIRLIVQDIWSRDGTDLSKSC